MFRFPFRSGLAAAALLCSVPAAAQQADGATDEPTGPEAPLTEVDPRAPLPPIPEIETDWRELFGEASEVGAEIDPDEAALGVLSYSVDQTGLGGFDFAGTFRELSVLIASAGDEVPSLAELNRRAREDEDLLRRLLRADGYYDPAVEITLEPVPERRAAQVARISIDPGPLYRFAQVNVELPAGAPRDLVSDALGLAPEDPVEAEAVQDAVARLRLRLPAEGYPFAEVAEPNIVVDHETRTASLSVKIATGPRSTFGEIRVEDPDPLFSARHIGRLARFDEGDPYDSADVDDLRRALIATGIVGSVDIEPVPAGLGPGGAERVDLVIGLSPAPLRTIAGQIGYNTTDGIRAEASWQHRNLIKPEGAVTFRGVAGTREQLISADLRRSNYKQRDRTLGLRAELSREDRDAYFARGFTIGGFVERETNIIWQKTWVYRLGAELLATQQRDRSGGIGDNSAPLETYFIAALPAQLGYDGTDDLLDPTQGFRLAGTASPEASLQDGAFGYLRAQVEASGYVPFQDGRLVLAGRSLFGTIFGARRGRIAPSRRYYAGGGGSVRGFGYQDVGPEDLDGDPLGGRSVVEFSLEARYRFGNFGVVPFIDAGQVYTSPEPRFSDMRYGAGIGARYYTSFGPIRLDVATPLDRQPGEPVVAVYVSIGQAF